MLGPRDGCGPAVSLVRFVVGRLVRRGRRSICALRKAAIEESTRRRGGIFGSQATGTLPRSTFQANPEPSPDNPIHRGRPSVRLQGVQTPADRVDYTNATPGIKQNRNVRWKGIDSRGCHGRLEYLLRVFQEEIHSPLIERDRKNSRQTSRHEGALLQQGATQDAAASAGFARSSGQSHVSWLFFGAKRELRPNQYGCRSEVGHSAVAGLPRPA